MRQNLTGVKVARPRAGALRALHLDPRHGSCVTCTCPGRARLARQPGP